MTALVFVDTNVLIVAAAAAQGCALLLSEDFQDGGVYAGVTVRSPFTLSVDEPAATFAMAPAAARGHPRRGRPRRVRTLADPGS